MDNQGEWTNIGEIEFTREDINTVCEILGDTNPFHSKRGVVQFSMLMGTVGALAYKWGAENEWFKSVVVVSCHQTHNETVWALKDTSYHCIANFVTFDNDKGVVNFKVVNPQLDQQHPRYLIGTGQINVKYTVPHTAW